MKTQQTKNHVRLGGFKCIFSNVSFRMLLFGLLAFSSLATLSLLPQTVSASSPWDGNIKTMEQFFVRNYNGTGTSQEISQTYISIIDSTCTGMDALGRIQDIIEHPDGKWTVFQNDQNFDLVWAGTTDPTNEFSFFGEAGEYSTVLYYDTLFSVYWDNGNPVCSVEYYGANTGIQTGYNGTSNVWMYNTTYPINYPEGYEGEIIPNVAPSELDVVKPTIKGDVRDRNLSLMSPANPLLEGETYTIKWLISKGDVGCNPETEECEGIYSLGGESQPDHYIEAVLPEHGQYNIVAVYLDLNGNVFNDTELYDFQQTSRLIEVDGSNFAIDTETDICDQNTQLCVPAPIGGGDNPIVRILKSITPNTFGLTEIITAPLAFLASLPTMVENCQPVNLTLPFLNTAVSYPCLTQTVYQPNFNQFLVIYQTIITGLVAYWIGIKIFATVKDIDSPDKDRIEVAQL